MGVIDQTYLPARQRTEDAELDDWMGIAPLPRLNVAPLPEVPGPAVPPAPVPEPEPTMGLTITPQGVPPEPPGGGLFSGIRAVESDINVGLTEAPKQILGGVRDAVVNAAEFLLQYSAPSIPGISEPALGTGAAKAITPEVGEAESVTGGLIRNASQFLTGFAAAGGAGGAGLLASMAKGAVVDLTVFDPAQPRVSNLINDLAPALKNPVMDYLAADPNDTDAEGRLKNMLEGLALGAATEGVIRVAKAIKGALVSRGAPRLLQGEAGSVKLPGGQEPATPSTRPPTPAAPAATPAPTPAAPAAARDAVREAAFESPGRFNPARQALPARLKDVTAQINVQAREMGLMETQTRGTITHQETLTAAKQLIRDGTMSVERILTFAPGTILNAEEGTAARLIRDAAVVHSEMIETAARAGSPEALSQVITAKYLASVLEAATEAASGTEPARALSARKIISRPAGQGLSRFQEVLQALQSETELGLPAERGVTRAIDQVRAVVTDAAEQTDSPAAKQALQGLGAQIGQALSQPDIPPGQLLAGLWEVILKGTMQAEQQAIDPQLLQMVLTRTQEAITTAVPEGHLLGGLWGVLAEGVTRAEQSIDPRLLLKFTEQLTDRAQREAFTQYFEHTSRTGRWANALLEARAAGLLTIRSIERNLIGSGMTTLWSVPERAGTAVTGMLASTEDRAVLSEVGAMLHGFWNAQSNAISAMGKAFWTGESQFLPGASQLEGHQFSAMSSEALGLGRLVDLPGGSAHWQASPMGAFFDVAGEIIRVPFKGLVAGDDYWKYVNYDMEKYALARREYDKLIEGGASPAQAAHEYSALITQPPDWLDKAATEHSLYTTFNDEVLNVAGKAILDVRANEGPVGQVARLILPFAKTPMNVAGYGAERTPGLNYLSIHYHNEMKAGGVRRDAAMARLSLGAGLYTGFTLMAANGLFTGKGPEDPELAKLYRDNGQMPYSITLPGMKPFSYLGYSPFSEILGNAADFAELMFQGADDVTLDRVATASVLSAAHVMEEYPMLKGLADIHDAMKSRSSKAEDAIQTVLKSVLPVPGFRNWAQTMQAFTDPNQRETRSPQGGATYTGVMGVLQREARAIIEEAKASTPWLSNYTYPKRDILGRPLLRQGGGWVLVPNAPSPQTPHPIFDELITQGVSVGLPTKAFSPGKTKQGVLDEDPDRAAVTLNADEWARYQELAGTMRLSDGEPDPGGLTLEQELTRVLGSEEYAQEADGPGGGKAAMLKDTFREYRQAAKEQLYAEQRTEGQPGRLETLVQQKALLREFEQMNKAEQAEARPELERILKRPVKIGILR